MAATYYIKQGSSIFELDATVKVVKTMKGQTTDHRISNGATAADHYVNLPNEFQISGMITDIGGDTTAFIDGITDLKETKKPFTFYFGSVVGEALTCFFSNITITQDTKYGVRKASGQEGQTFKDKNAFAISATIKQVRISVGVTKSTSKDEKYKDVLAAKKDANGNAIETNLSKEEEALKNIREGRGMAATGDVPERIQERVTDAKVEATQAVEEVVTEVVETPVDFVETTPLTRYERQRAAFPGYFDSLGG